MKIKTSELTGAALDWAVAKCEGAINGDDLDIGFILEGGYSPSTDWAQGGPIIERELISLECLFDVNEWYAWTPAPEQETGEARARGDTPLIAAMRCYVASQLGDAVEIPEGVTT
jgi:hypothetical protein